METYRVKVGANGEVVLPLELRKLFGLVAEDTLDLCVDSEGKVFVHTAERSVRPLSDFFEDLIIRDLLAEGCMGECLRTKLLKWKLRLSTVLDRMSEEAHRAHQNGQTIKWWETQALSFQDIDKTSNGIYDVMLTTRSINDLVVLPEEELRDIIEVFVNLEQEPSAFKRLKGPYYETYRVSFHHGSKEYRVVYTIFPEENFITVLTVGMRKVIYDRLNGIA